MSFEQNTSLVRDLHMYGGIYAAAGLSVINRLLKCQASVSVSGIAMSQVGAAKKNKLEAKIVQGIWAVLM